MIYRIILAACSLITTMALTAQEGEVKKAKPVFQSVNLVGFLEGETGTAAQVQSVNGFGLNGYAIGIGIGLDYYVQRSVPLFLDVRKDILNKPQTPFIYTDAGVNFPWTGKSFDWVSDTDPGLYYDLGIGYKVPVKSNAFVISAGYSFKAYSQEEKIPVWCIMAPCPEQVNNYELKLKRLSVKAGFVF